MMQLTQVLQQFTARYRNALLTKAALLTGLGAAIVALLSWRLRAMHAPSLWAVGAPVALGLMGAGALAAWIARHWLSSRETAAHLDRTLGLQQRLMTAAEVGARPELPALYEALLEDTARRLDPEQGHVPRPMDRTAGLLAVAVLILLLWWPDGSRLPFPIMPKPQMTKPTPPPVNPPPPPSQPPAQQPDQSKSPSQGGTAQQPSSGGQQPSSEGQNQPSSSGDNASSKSSAAQSQNGRSQDGQKQGQPGSGTSQAASQGHQNPEQGSSSSHAGSAQRQSGSHDQQQGAGTSSQPSSGAQRPSSQQAGARPAGQQAGSSAQPQPTGRPASPNNMSSKSGGQPQPGSTQSPSQQPAGTPQARNAASSSSSPGTGSLPQPGQGAGQSSSGNQEELKADIEQLLKEVSGELKELQGQLAASQDQAHPTAGTSTNPQLYEAPMKLDQQTPGAGQMPLQLQTDTAQTRNQRTVGGTGTPSRQAAAGSPQLQPQSVQLSDAPQDETPASRQPIPPEYRSAFEKLQQQSQPQPAR